MESTYRCAAPIITVHCSHWGVDMDVDFLGESIKDGPRVF